MTAQLGRSLILKVEDSPGAGTYTTVAGMKTTKFTINNAMVDVTSKEDNAARKLLVGAGLKSMSISAEGVFKDDASFNIVRTAAVSNTDHLKYQIVIPGVTYDETYTGEFMITTLEQSGTHDDAVTYSITLESDGTIVVS